MSMGMDSAPVPVWVTPEAEVPQFGTEDWVRWLVTHPALTAQVRIRAHPTKAWNLVEVPEAGWADVVGSLVDHYRQNMGGPDTPVPVQHVRGTPVLVVGGLRVHAQHAPAGTATWDPAAGWADGEGRTL